VIDASVLLDAPQLAGVVVSPVGLFRSIESNLTVMPGGVVVPGSTGPAISDRLGGKSAAERRQADAEVSTRTPDCGKWGFLAVTDHDVALTTTQPPKMVGRQLGELVERVPRIAIRSAELDGGWRHPALYMFSSAPFRIMFADGTMWVFEVSRFYRRHAKRVIRALG
jgi:hypothetical protein